MMWLCIFGVWIACSVSFLLGMAWAGLHIDGEEGGER